MTYTYSQALAFKAAMYKAAQSIYADSGSTPVAVTYGAPGTIPDENDVVVFGAVRSTQQFATMATNRTREELLELDVTVNCRGGSDLNDDQATAERGYTLLGQLENYVRTTDSTLMTITGSLVPVVRWCFLTAHSSTGITDPADLPAGRWIVIDATFTAPARITN